MTLPRLGRSAIRRSLTLLALLLPTGVAAAQDRELPPAQPVSPAPAGAWTVEGGNPARSRGSTAVAPSRPPTLTWSFEAKGEMVGEPLVWGDRVVVVDRTGPDRQSFSVLDRQTGERLGAEVQLRSVKDAAPTLWGDRLVVREGDSLLGFSIGPRGPRRTWRVSVEGELGRPLLVDETIYFVVGGALVAQTFGRRDPEWTSGRDFTGPLALRDGELAGLQQRQNGLWYSARVDPRSGDARNWRILIDPGDSIGEADDAMIIPLDGGECVMTAGPIGLGSTPTRSVVVIGGDQQATGTVQYSGVDQQSAPALCGDGWLTLEGEQGKSRWILMTSLESGVRLTTGAVHASLLERSSSAAVTPSLLYFAGLAVDPTTLEVLWGIPTHGAMIPMDRGLLVAREDRSGVEAWLEQRDLAARPIDPRGLAQGNWSAQDAVAVTGDGEVVRGDFELQTGADGPVLAQTDGRRKESWPLASVLLIGTDDELVYASGRRSLFDACALLALEAQREALEDIADRIPRSRDPELIEQALTLAASLGADEKLLERLQRAADKAAAQTRKPKPEDSAELSAELSALGRVPARVLWDWSERVPADFDGRDAVQWGLVRELLKADPADDRARQWLAQRLPEGAELVGEGEILLDWMDYLAATRRIPVELIDSPRSESADLTLDQRRVGRAGTGWRNDLVGVRSPELLVVTPLDAPGSLSTILAQGELMVETLDSWFAGFEPVRTARPSLELHVYSSRAEYLRVSQQGGHAGLSWTAGHFDPGANLSRLFVPTGEGGFERALATFLHELTHHWLDSRCPAFSGDQARVVDADQSGYWIVEGFACIAEGLVLDVDRWEAQVGARLGERLALAASCGPEQLIPWEQLFSQTQVGMGTLVGQEPQPIAVPLQLGWLRTADRVALFYAQSAAAARYLFEAEDGRHRRALLEYVVAFYTGDRARLDVQKAFGLSPQELGARVLAWSREQVALRMGQR
ncbi:hypothetical protein [Engelhardtia mirabilis]|uniref:Peptidase MA-like domain-containing protein n=1 Tax=Engelhardtia mirabilis TaxID=2528011 RepID=A0A518BK23_9BACT|nr:hypothetical protein Pla133_23720 [Planctomycetes bacterium Pla133]QDV01619.1 hypothetical protein Pla86_23710 [Planctomycetes bacterium Pla86]